ncbi:HalOD1 output domain-containing protein [Halorussus ruber]|uniref:HalOD1 output domain-containing protein n=1 Tax=Halorussus ruber TaxID=1126238 RepID=UPI001092A937|nr:HalOD1 output domain-containing protein [Halorussus ruber]
MYDPESLVATAVDLGNSSPNVFHGYCDPADGGTLAQTILETLESASDCPATEMSVRLYDAIDPDALNDLFEPTRSGSMRDDGRVSFSIDKFAVDVHANGHVFVRPMT